MSRALAGLGEWTSATTAHGAYRLHYYVAASTHWYPTVTAYTQDGLIVGEAEFVPVRDYTADPDNEHPPISAWKGWSVNVAEGHRRKGLARAMYALVEERSGLKVVPGDFQTPDGASFVSGRKR